MYAEFYKLRTLPFQLTPDPRFFFSSSVHNSAMAHLTYGLSQGEGFIIITGDVGAGKTTLVGHLLDQLDPDKFVAGKIVTSNLEAEQILRMAVSAFGLPSEGIDKASLLQRLDSFLQDIHRQGKRALLVVDEAQNLAISALEELRMLSNIVVGQRAPMQCFLMGQPQFRTTLASRDLDQLRQRVIASYHLGPLNLRETRAYIEHRLQLAGWDKDPVITAHAFEEIFRYTEGVPRMINLLCSRLLVYGYLEEVHEIDETIVQRVTQDHANETRQITDDGSAEAAGEPAPRTNGAEEPEVPAPNPTTETAAAPESDARDRSRSETARRLLDVRQRLTRDGGERGAQEIVQAEDALDEIEEILDRMTILEDAVSRHERTLRRILQFTGDRLEARRDDGLALDDAIGERQLDVSIGRRRIRAQRRRRRLAADRQRDER